VNRFSLLCMLLLVITGCEEKVQPSVVPVATAELPSQESWKSTVVFSDSGQRSAVLWSGHIASYDQQRVTLLSDSVRVDFFNESEVHTSLLTARRGKVNDLTHDLEVYENVVVVSDSGATLKTERLFWDNATRKIHTDAFVDIQSPREHIMGHGLESDQGLKQYKILHVTGQAVTND
jgi:LPS export ABC transporter protein LptC